MLSRVAESVYWMARYMERTNICLRVLKTFYIAHQNRFTQMDWCYLGEKFGIPYAENLSTDEIQYNVIFDSNFDYSIINNIFKARENARSAQDHINRELWQSLNDFYHLVRSPQLQKQFQEDPIMVFDRLINQTMLYYGVIDISMFRGEAFIFLKLGKYIERSFQVSYFTKIELEWDMKFGLDLSEQNWRYLLIAICGYDMYISENPWDLDRDLVLKQILYHKNFPNSLTYIWERITHFSNHMKQDDIKLFHKDIDFTIGKNYAYLKYTPIPMGEAEKIEFLDQLQKGYIELAKVLNTVYFGLL